MSGDFAWDEPEWAVSPQPQLPEPSTSETAPACARGAPGTPEPKAPDAKQVTAQEEHCSDHEAIGRAKELVAAVAAAHPLRGRRYDHQVQTSTQWLRVVDKPARFAKESVAGQHNDVWSATARAAGLRRLVVDDVSVDELQVVLGVRAPSDGPISGDQLRAVQSALQGKIPGATSAEVWGTHERPDVLLVYARRPQPRRVPASVREAPRIGKLYTDRDYARRLFRDEAGLARSESTLRPDGSRYTRWSAPKVVAIEDHDDGPAIIIKPLPGQVLSDFVRALPRLQQALALPNAAVWYDSTHTRVVLAARCTVPSWPDRVIPEPDSMLRVRSEAEAIAGYPELALPVGRTIDGDDIKVRLQDALHVLVAGGTGAGKTRTLLTWVTMLLAGGAIVVVADAKGEDDWSPLAEYREGPGIVMLARTISEILRAVAFVAREREERARRSRLMKSHGIEGYAEPALVFIFDEFRAFRLDLAERKMQGDAASVMSAMNGLLSKGRSRRVHVMFVAQSVYDDSFPRKWMSNIRLRLWLGKEGSATDFRNFAGGDAGGAVAMEAANHIPKSARGRGIVMQTSSDDTEGQASAATLFQAPYGYTPGIDPVKETPDSTTLDAWELFRHEFEAVPRLVPRIGIDFTQTTGVTPDTYVKQSKDGTISPPTAPGGDAACWHSWSYAEIAQLPLIPLDDTRGPIHSRERFDPTSPAYEGDLEPDGPGTHFTPRFSDDVPASIS
ncbi:type IV secretory system conjugative DNA transfer family protein [Gordonia sp. VNK1]|uniref:type IV secretory system conjugative DNA transfer family protein n=1 Tax=Gordonia oleivorans TaxID=3156618 RepID=UPI0032B31BD9